MASSSTGQGTKKSRTSGTRKNSTRTRSSQRSGRRQSKQMDLMNLQIMMIVLAGVCVLLFLSLLGLCGSVGDKFSDFFFGSFGMLAYLFPALVIMGEIVMYRKNFSGAAKIHVFTGIILYVALMTMTHLLTGTMKDVARDELFQICSLTRMGGGVVGGSLALLLRPLSFGAYLILIVIILGALIILSEGAVIDGVIAGSDRAVRTTKDTIRHTKENWADYSDEASLKREQRLKKQEMERAEKERVRQIAEEKRAEERRIRQAERDAQREGIVRGVTMDTEIPKDGEKYTDVRKIKDKVNKNKDRYSEDIIEIEPIQEKTPDAGIFDGQVLPLSEANVVEESEKEKEKDLPFVDRMVGLEPEVRKNLHSEEEESQESEVPTSPMEEVADVEEDPFDVDPNHIDDYSTFAREQENSTSGIKTQEKMGAEKKLSGINPGISSTKAEVDPDIAAIDETKEMADYVFPPMDLLKSIRTKKNLGQQEEIKHNVDTLRETLQSFGVNVTVNEKDVCVGPTVTRYELLPGPGTKVSKIVSLADDIKLNLAAADIRIEAPIPGKSAVGIEVPNKESVGVSLRELLESEEFQNSSSNLAFAAGKDIGGKPIIADIAKMPHLLIAGATGSGKSVCINTIIMSLLYHARPDDVKLIMVDPKVVELSMYNDIPHLLIPVVTDPKKASQALNWAVAEMDQRYKKFANMQVRDLKGYNAKVAEILKKSQGVETDPEDLPKKLPQIVIIIDELADLMMVASNEVEDAICRLAQLARACGIHLVIATQRPTVNVITGLIKANVPSRIAFSVSSGTDSRTILDMNGAEKLLGKGDMLYFPSGLPKPIRSQGAFVSDEEINAVVDFIKEHNQGVATSSQSEEIEAVMNNINMAGSKTFDHEQDEYFVEAARLCVESEKASSGMLQRRYKIGFNRAARIIDQLCEAGIVGPEEGTKPRKILMTQEELEAYLSTLE
ncbi:MAG: DNA translocase FtsK 4TM domain-containing protein [Lachnospiraceae bacterium]|nr:DNA translocase FtsK 4TM domain-containing protein [Lachnospiraceae bacterium]